MKKQKGMKRYEELEFKDDFMFGKVMEDLELCHDVLECLLGRPVGKLMELQTQKEFRFTSDGKPIRLDVYNKDSEGVVFDAEMQNKNNKSVTSLGLPKRSRFYQSAIDVDFMNKGNLYRKLPETNIMFLCTFDPFGWGLSHYTFVETCVEKQELTLKDGTKKIFYNCTYTGDDISVDLRGLYDYIMSGMPSDNLTRRIDQAVFKGRKNEIWRSEFMKEWVIIQEAKEEGREEGREEERKNTEKERERADKAEERIKELEAILSEKNDK